MISKLKTLSSPKLSQVSLTPVLEDIKLAYITSGMRRSILEQLTATLESCMRYLRCGCLLIKKNLISPFKIFSFVWATV